MNVSTQLIIDADRLSDLAAELRAEAFRIRNEHEAGGRIEEEPTAGPFALREAANACLVLELQLEPMRETLRERARAYLGL